MAMEEEGSSEAMDTLQEDRDSDSGSSEDEREELELEKQVSKLEANLNDNPYHYESHVQLIALLRQLGDLDRARKAREGMSNNFPLTEELWLQWVRDEAPLCSLPEAALEMRSLFDKSVEDYLSVPLWLEFSKFTVDHMSLMPEGMDYCRQVFERAVVSCGLHVGRSKELWDSYTQFERAVLNSVQELQQSDPSDALMVEQVESQYERVEKLYKRQLAVPHIGMEDGFHDYQALAEGVAEDSLPVYKIARKKLEQFRPFEEELSCDLPPLETYTRYLDHLIQSKSDPSLTLTLYKRAVAHHCLDTGLWTRYLKFLDSNFASVGSVVVPGYRSAVRNCPWVLEFWTGYGRAMERVQSNHKEIIAVYERGLEGNLASPTDYLTLWTSYCDYLRRRVPSDLGDEPDHVTLLELRGTFKRAKENLETYYGKDGDPTDSLTRYQSSLEARCYGNTEESRRLWGEVMSRHGKEAKYWIEFANLERSCGDIENCRKVLQRGANSASDDPELVCQALLQFEREVGSLENYEAAEIRCQAQLDRVRERREKAAEKEGQRREDVKRQRRSDKGRGSGQEEGSRKRGPPSDHSHTAPTKKQRVGGENVPQALPEAEPVEPVPTEGPKESRTVFVSNLGVKATEAQLRELFSKCGAISDVRLIKSRGKDSTNVFAYIEYATPKPLPEALQLDKTVLDERTMYVSQFKEKDRTGNTSGFKPRSEARSTVYVSHIAHHVTDSELRELFSQCGELKEVRLVKNKDGRSKGFAYIEYTTESSANVAVARLNNHTLAGKPLKVAISNPPGRGSKVTTFAPTEGRRETEFKKPSFAPRAVQGSNPVVRMQRRTHIPSLLPRALAKKSNSETKSSGNSQVNKMSNDDFRQLLAKKE